MARQSNTPVSFQQTKRMDTAVRMSSGRAGKVVPIMYAPILPGDSGSGRLGVDIELAEMPRPLLNGVVANFQVWAYPKQAHPKFAGTDEVLHSFTGEPIKGLGFADRTPPAFFDTISGASVTTAAASEFFQTLGLHIPAGETINADLVDAFVHIYNFRLAAHSSRLTRRQYAAEDIAEACALPPAFWPSGRFSRVVPDYERALIVGSLDLDVAAGQVTIHSNNYQLTGANPYPVAASTAGISGSAPDITWGADQLWGDLTGSTVGVTLADIDKARTTQAFAKLRAAYAGNDTTGFDNDDAIVAMLMQGLAIPEDQFKRPILLDSKRVPVGFTERFATDGASLDASVTQGRASAQLSINVPRMTYGGVIIATVEVLPERLDERQSDEWLLATSVAELPNALRDVQRVEPVDLVPNRRIDAKHTTPTGIYGYEPMNDRWNRQFTHLGGAFYQATPGAAWTEQRSAIWQTDIVDPAFNVDHWLCPEDFPHDVFSDTLADAFEYVCRHQITFQGNTQFGDVLMENSDDYETVQAEGAE